MGKSFEYRDKREQAFMEISDKRYNTEPKTLTTIKQITRDDGDYTYTQMDIRNIFTILEHQDRMIRKLSQGQASAFGQLEYMYKNDFEGYRTMISEIRAQYPIPTE